MVCVPEDAVLDPCQFLNKVAQDYHIRLTPPTLSGIAQTQYLIEMIHKIKTDDRPLIVTNVSRWDNTVRDFVSVRRMRAGDVAEVYEATSIILGEL